MPPSDFARREQDDGLKRTLRVRRKFLQVCFELKCLTEFSELTRKHFSPVSARRIAQEEIFGPVLSPDASGFRTLAEAFERANNIPYGFSIGVWTESVVEEKLFVSAPARNWKSVNVLFEMVQ